MEGADLRRPKHEAEIESAGRNGLLSRPISDQQPPKLLNGEATFILDPLSVLPDAQPSFAVDDNSQELRPRQFVSIGVSRVAMSCTFQ